MFGMWNVLKADFLAARWLAYTAASQRLRETGEYHDTQDYANYRTKQSLAVIAQRAAFDVPDKVAGFVTEYLGLPGDPKHLYFSNRWYRKRKDRSSPLELQPEILKEVEAGNPGLVALADLASDLEVEGSLGSRRLLRHSGTHRFVVLHDMMVSFRESQFIEHYRQADFETTTVETLQMCRAALTYLRELVVWRERRLAKAQSGKLRGRLYVPSHHWIRGSNPAEPPGPRWDCARQLRLLCSQQLAPQPGIESRSVRSCLVQPLPSGQTRRSSREGERQVDRSSRSLAQW